MVNLSQKIIILFSLLAFLLAGNSSAFCTVNSATDPTSPLSSFTQVKRDLQIATVSAAKNTESSTGHKNIPALKQRLRGKRSTTSLSTIEASQALASILPSLLHQEHPQYTSTVTWQNSSLRNLRSIVLLI
jgi:hypothetical protein